MSLIRKLIHCSVLLNRASLTTVRRAIEWLDHRADSNESNVQTGLNQDSSDHSGHTKTLNWTTKYDSIEIETTLWINEIIKSLTTEKEEWEKHTQVSLQSTGIVAND